LFPLAICRPRSEDLSLEKEKLKKRKNCENEILLAQEEREKQYRFTGSDRIDVVVKNPKGGSGTDSAGPQRKKES